MFTIIKTLWNNDTIHVFVKWVSLICSAFWSHTRIKNTCTMFLFFYFFNVINIDRVLFLFHLFKQWKFREKTQSISTFRNYFDANRQLFTNCKMVLIFTDFLQPFCDSASLLYYLSLLSVIISWTFCFSGENCTALDCNHKIMSKHKCLKIKSLMWILTTLWMFT